MGTEQHYEVALKRLVAPGQPFEMRTTAGERGPIRTFVQSAGSVRDLVAHAASRRGDRVFLVQGARRVTFQQFAASAWGVASTLTADYGLVPGDRVAIVGANSVDWLVSMFGATSAGAVGVGLNPMLTIDEMVFALGDCRPRFVVVDGQCAESLAEAMRVASVTPDATFVLGPVAPPGFVSAESLLQPTDEAPAQAINTEDPFVILYSSGTSARPKGCITTHLGTVTQLRGMILAGLLSKETSSDAPVRSGRQAASLLTGPLFHVAGLHAAVGGALVTGMKLVLTESTRFDPLEVLRLLEQERVTHWGAVPTVVQRVIGHPDVQSFDLSALESVSIGGAAVTDGLLAMVRSVVGTAPRLGNGWGMTETHGGITMNAGKDLAEHIGSVGRVHPYLDLRVVNDKFVDQPTGQSGELLVRGPTVFSGYWDRPQETTDAIHDGWFRTGDIGFVDDGGFVYLVDRASDLIIRGGENISSFEVESCLSSHPDVVETAVIGVPDDDLGERVVAFVRLSVGAAPDEVEIRDFVKARLARYKVPSSIFFIEEELPVNAAGKVMKRTLRDALRGATP